MGRHSTSDARESALEKVRQLADDIHTAWPLLKGYRNYSSNGIDRGAWIDYVSTVAPRGNKEV
jgi:hypothetical protein